MLVMDSQPIRRRPIRMANLCNRAADAVQNPCNKKMPDVWICVICEICVRSLPRRENKPITSIFEADFALQTKYPHEPVSYGSLMGRHEALSWGSPYPKVFDLNLWCPAPNKYIHKRRPTDAIASPDLPPAANVRTISRLEGAHRPPFFAGG
jgi:hypothetical protein